MNYLVIPCFKLNDNQQPPLSELLKVSAASYRRNLAGPWTLETLQEDLTHLATADAWHHMTAELFDMLHDHWQRGDNVLRVDVDTVCVKPTEIFGRYQRMFLPWMTCCFDSRYPTYMNGGVAYYPAAMEARTWEIGAAMVRRYDYQTWADDQRLWNDMFWSQSERPTPDPSLNFSPHVSSPLLIDEAQIIHLHQTRNRAEALKQMRELTEAQWQTPPSRPQVALHPEALAREL